MSNMFKGCEDNLEKNAAYKSNNHTSLEKLEMDCCIILEHLQLYQCDKCCDKFYSSKDLRTHRKTHIRNAQHGKKERNLKTEICVKRKCENSHARFELENSSGHNPIFFKNNKSTYNDHIETEVLKPKLEPIEINEKHKLKMKISRNPENNKHQVELKFQPIITQELKADNSISMLTKIQVQNNKVEKRNEDSDDLYTCGQCPKSFSTLSGITEHLANHLTTYSCKTCQKSFSSKAQRNKHVRNTHSSKRKVKCTMCDKEFKSNSNMQIHLRIHTGERPFPCKECGKRFTQTASLYTHMKIHMGIKDHVCAYCNKAFSEYYNMKNHERTHTKERPFECHFCSRAFSDPSALKRHIRTHTGDKIYHCQLCSMKFSDASGLIAHRKRHYGIKNATCNFCDKKFYTSHEAQRHESSVHMGIKKFECDICRKKFSVKPYLKLHIERNHMRSVPCKICKTKFYSNIELQRHRAKGCVRDKFECDLCDEKFPLKIDMKKHVEKIHSEPLYCNICLSKFFTDFHLQNHKSSGACIRTKRENKDRVIKD